MDTIIDVPAYKGSYILLIKLDKDNVMEIGRSGPHNFQRGWYIYVGSAQGSGGVRARLKTHLGVNKNRHWHIDWLLRHAKIVRTYYLIGTKNRECVWSQAIANSPYITVPVKRFGASDCVNKCPAHLFRIAITINVNDIDIIIRNYIPDHLMFIDV